MRLNNNIMNQAFRRAASARLAECIGEQNDKLLVGFETEVSVVRRNDLEPVSQETRDAIIADLDGFGDVELGAFQLELRTSPLDVLEIGFVGLCEALRGLERRARRAANKLGATILRCGFSPNPRDLGAIARTDALKYRAVPNYHDERRGGWVNTLVGRADPVDVGHASVIALANSVQFNVQVPDPGRAIAVANRLLSVTPDLCAVAANARFLAGRDLGLADGRMLVWERSHDTRGVIEFLADAPTRIGLPATYYVSLEDYLDRVASFPLILDAPDAAFQVGIGLYWSDVRIKFPGNRLVVEFRPLSVQPTAFEDVALFAAVLGLTAVEEHVLPLRPMDLLARDRDAAFTHGLDADLHTWNGGAWVLAPGREVLADVLKLARSGLVSLGLAKDADTFLPVLEHRLTQGTPSERLARDVSELAGQGLSVSDAVREALRHHCLNSDEE
jgi:hypothetical protein